MWLFKIKKVFKDSDLRKKIFLALFGLIVFRLGANIPIPGIDADRLSAFLSGNQFFGLLNIFSGGGLSNLSLFMLGVGPYITATIIMQLFTMVFPRLKEMYSEDGEAGRTKFNQYARLLTVPLAVLQAFALLTLLTKQGVIGALSPLETVTNIIVVTAGSILLMWIGELITDLGIGNGVSLLIFSGIVASLPTYVQQIIFTFEPTQLPIVIASLVVGVVVIYGVVIVTEAERPIPISYAKQIRGSRMYGGASTHLPIRVNQAGVIPIIFALSILLFPQLIGSFLASSSNAILIVISKMLAVFNNNLLLYGSLYFVLVFLFSYFYTAVTFDPESISTNLQKSGAFVPGIRPGPSTAQYIGHVVNRVTLLGAGFLGAVAVLPLVMQSATGITALAIGGTGLLIVVSVVLETVKLINSQITMREYE